MSLCFSTHPMSQNIILLIRRDTALRRERERERESEGGREVRRGQRLREDSGGRKNVVNYSPIAEMDGVLPFLLLDLVGRTQHASASITKLL